MMNADERSKKVNTLIDCAIALIRLDLGDKIKELSDSEIKSTMDGYNCEECRISFPEGRCWSKNIGDFVKLLTDMANKKNTVRFKIMPSQDPFPSFVKIVDDICILGSWGSAIGEPDIYIQLVCAIE